MPLEDIVFDEDIFRQDDEAFGWIVAYLWKNRRQDFTPGDSTGPNAGNSAARPVHLKEPINKLITTLRLP
ncbi:hypothetical protein MRX96_058859 [Rhipicephalus microplus]